MKFKITKEVRESIAGEVKKISSYGGIALGFFGYSASSPAIFLGAFLWWMACQTIAHLIMSIQQD